MTMNSKTVVAKPPTSNRLQATRVSSTKKRRGLKLGGDWIIKSIIYLIGFVMGSMWSSTKNLMVITTSSQQQQQSSSSNLPTATTTTAKSDAVVVEVAATLATTRRRKGRIELESTSSSQRERQNETKSDDHGWQSIDVYFGSTGIREMELPDPNQKWFSQAAQEQAVLSLLRYKKNGYFVDLASNDATYLSNTYILERDYQWEGLCIEPNPMYWYNLTHYRPDCQIVGAIIGQTTDDIINFRYGAKEHGGIVGDEFDNSPRWKKESKQEYTISLQTILQRYQVPNIIDYLSLDVEGAEFYILKGFPFHLYKINVMTIERPSLELQQLLSKQGYQQLLRLSSWGEMLYAHTDFLSELDLSHLEEFHGKKQKHMKPYATILPHQTQRQEERQTSKS